jgi:hypothetical protein
MQLVFISAFISLLTAAPLLDGLLGGGAPPPGYGAQGYGFGAYRPRPLAGVNLRNLSVLSPKQKDTQINIDEGMYNSQGYNPMIYAMAGQYNPYGGPIPGPAGAADPNAAQAPATPGFQ